MRACRKCGAVEQEREVADITFRWRKEGPPPGEGWRGPLYPDAALQIYEQTKRERFFDCKFVCPNAAAIRALRSAPAGEWRPLSDAAKAYGLLWTYQGTNWGVHNARRLLLAGLTKEEQERGISFAQMEVLERRDCGPVQEGSP